MRETIAEPAPASEKHQQHEVDGKETLLRSKQKGRRKWKIAWGIPLLLSLLFQTVPFPNIWDSETIHNRQNRQLLEHGLRGGDSVNGNGALVDHTNTINTTTIASSSSIPVSNISVPLFAHSGTHHVYLYIGSPPQRQTLIVDTGSRAMAFPCLTPIGSSSNCCGVHASPYFDPSKSTTHIVSNCGSCLLEGISSCESQQLQLPLITKKQQHTPTDQLRCTFSQKYTEGSSWSATEVEDIVWLGNSDSSQSLQEFLPKLAVPYPFGCQTESFGLFRNQYADGILGLSIHETSLIAAFEKEGLIASNSFSLCFTPTGGVLSLGGRLDSMYATTTTRMKTTPVTNRQEHGYYSVEVISLVVGESMVVTNATTKPRLLKDMNAGNGCILDSGTTDSYFPASLSRAVRKAVVAYGIENTAQSSSSGNPNSQDPLDPSLDLFSSRLRQREYTFEEFQTLLPTITVVFANEVTLKLLPQHYMEDVPLENGKVVLWEGTKRLTNRLYFEERKGSVLGQNAFFGYEVYFDAGGSHQEARIGIAPSDCHAAEGGLLSAQ